MVTSWLDLFANWVLSYLIFFASFYVPGRVILKRFKNNNAGETLVLSTFLGIALLGLSGYIFGYLNLRFLAYPYFGYFWFLWIKNASQEIQFLKKAVSNLISDKLLILIILLGLPICLSTVITSGLPVSKGVGFFGINPIDGSYHIALIRSLVRSTPPQEPGMVGVLVENYHYWSDLILAEIVRIFSLPPVNLFYQYFPAFIAIFYALSGYYVGLSLTNNKPIARLISFFLLFSGNLGYLVMLLLTGKLTFTVASLDNSALLFTNPPRVLAQAMYLAGVITLSKWIKTEKMSWGIITAILLGICVGIKVYVGILASLGLGILFLLFVIKKKYKMIIPIILAGLISIFIFFPTNKNAGGMFWSPLSWPKHFFAQGTISQLMWHLQMDEFKVHNNQLRITILSIQMTLVFLFITFGTRFLGILRMVYGWKRIDKYLYLFLVVPFVLFIFVGLFFLQESGIFESFNFIAVSTIPAVIFVSIFLGDIIETSVKSKILKVRYLLFGFMILVIAMTTPRTIYDARHYYRLFLLGSGQIINRDQADFFNVIQKEVSESSILLTDPKDQLGNYSPYVAAFTGKLMYYSGEGILKAHGIDVDDKSKMVKELFEQKDGQSFSNKAKYLGINYLYLQKPVSEIFQNSDFFDTITESASHSLIVIK